MSSVSPVTHFESSEAKNTAAGAISSVCTDSTQRGHRFKHFSHIAFMKSTRYHSFCNDHPGVNGIHADFRGPSSFASVRVIASTAPFVAL